MDSGSVSFGAARAGQNCGAVFALHASTSTSHTVVVTIAGMACPLLSTQHPGEGGATENPLRVIVDTRSIELLFAHGGRAVHSNGLSFPNCQGDAACPPSIQGKANVSATACGAWRQDKDRPFRKMRCMWGSNRGRSRIFNKRRNKDTSALSYR